MTQPIYGKVPSFWKSIDEAFMMLGFEIFEHCFSLEELHQAGKKVGFILNNRYPENKGKEALLAELRLIYKTRREFLDSLGEPPAPGQPPTNPPKLEIVYPDSDLS